MSKDIIGVDRVKAVLQNVKVKSQKRVTDSLERNAELMVRRATLLAPTGPRGAARSKASRKYGPLKSQIQSYPAALTVKGVSVKIDVGEAFYARWVEHGRHPGRGNPFFYPAYRTIRDRWKRSMKRAVRLAVRESLGVR